MSATVTDVSISTIMKKTIQFEAFHDRLDSFLRLRNYLADEEVKKKCSSEITEITGNKDETTVKIYIDGKKLGKIRLESSGW